MAMGLERKLGLQPPGVRLRGVEPPRPEGSGAMTETLVPIGCLLGSFLGLLVQFAKPSQPIEAPLAARASSPGNHSLRPPRRQNCAKVGCVVPHARPKRSSDRANTSRS